jgi:hypothetical protein
MHATNTVQAVDRMANMFPEEAFSASKVLGDISMNLAAIIIQRLAKAHKSVYLLLKSCAIISSTSLPVEKPGTFARLQQGPTTRACKLTTSICSNWLVKVTQEGFAQVDSVRLGIGKMGYQIPCGEAS